MTVEIGTDRIIGAEPIRISFGSPLPLLSFGLGKSIQKGLLKGIGLSIVAIIGAAILMQPVVAIIGLMLFLGFALSAPIVHYVGRERHTAEIVRLATAERENCIKALEAVSPRPFLHADYTAYASKADNRLVPQALAFDGEKIYVVDDGCLKILDWSEVVAWEWKMAGYSVQHTVGGDPRFAEGRALADNLANERNVHLAQRDSGFFIHCSSDKKPVWQFCVYDKQILEKWEEIFREISTGDLKAA